MTSASLLRRSAATAALLCAAAPAFAQSDAGRIAQLEARVAELESRQSGPDLTFGSETASTIEIYGYVKADFIYDFGAELGNTTFGLVGLTDDDGGDFFNATANQTRLGLRTTTPTSFGDLETQVEIDFYGADGAFSTGGAEPRLRHANATLGNVMVGKYWTTFMPLNSYPVTLDFQGVAGIPFARQEQIRYTHEAGNYVAEFAIEDSNGSTNSPVAVAALAYDTDPLLLRVSGIYGQVDDGLGGDEDAYGFTLSTTAGLWSGATLDAAYTQGEGIASYMVFLGDDVNAAGEAIEIKAAYAGLTQEVGEKLTLRAIYGWRENDEVGPTNDFEELTSVHLNAQYQIVENASLGVEYFHGTLDRFGGESYDVDRIQTSMQIDF